MCYCRLEKYMCLLSIDYGQFVQIFGRNIDILIILHTVCAVQSSTENLIFFLWSKIHVVILITVIIRHLECFVNIVYKTQKKLGFKRIIVLNLLAS